MRPVKRHGKRFDNGQASRDNARMFHSIQVSICSDPPLGKQNEGITSPTKDV